MKVETANVSTLCPQLIQSTAYEKIESLKFLSLSVIQRNSNGISFLI